MILALAGCGAHLKASDPILTGATAEVAVTHHCMAGAPVEGDYADKDLAREPGLGPTRYKLTSAANAQREAYLVKVRPWIAGCR
jgi:hypothetical protein